MLAGLFAMPRTKNIMSLAAPAKKLYQPDYAQHPHRGRHSKLSCNILTVFLFPYPFLLPFLISVSSPRMKQWLGSKVRALPEDS